MPPPIDRRALAKAGLGAFAAARPDGARAAPAAGGALPPGRYECYVCVDRAGLAAPVLRGLALTVTGDGGLDLVVTERPGGAPVPCRVPPEAVRLLVAALLVP